SLDLKTPRGDVTDRLRRAGLVVRTIIAGNRGRREPAARCGETRITVVHDDPAIRWDRWSFPIKSHVDPAVAGHAEVGPEGSVREIDSGWIEDGPVIAARPARAGKIPAVMMPVLVSRLRLRKSARERRLNNGITILAPVIVVAIPRPD